MMENERIYSDDYSVSHLPKETGCWGTFRCTTDS